MICRKCKVDRSLEDWYICRSSRTGYQSMCKPCMLEKKRAWRVANPHLNRERAIKYYYANKGKVLSIKLEQRKSDPEKYRKIGRDRYWQNPSRSIAWTRRWQNRQYAENPLYWSLKNKQRKAGLRACSSWANKQYITDMYMLARLVTEATGVDYHVDHIVPLRSSKVCGLHNEFNLQVIAGRENISKQNRFWPNMP
jgi:hypothetical protein